MSNFLFILMVAVRLMTVSPFMVEGQSMDPTLYDKELFLIDRNVSADAGFDRGDIVVFNIDDDYFYVKRIIALPGETVRLQGESLAIKKGDGDYQSLNEPYLLNGQVNYGDKRYFIVPSGEYFVMGDNRAHSKDSRTFVYPYVNLSQIYGKYIYP